MLLGLEIVRLGFAVPSSIMALSTGNNPAIYLIIFLIILFDLIKYNNYLNNYLNYAGIIQNSGSKAQEQRSFSNNGIAFRQQACLT